MYALYTLLNGDHTVAVTTDLLELFKTIVPNGTKEKVQYCTTIDKLTNMLLESVGIPIT
jgi:hypothetical protein